MSVPSHMLEPKDREEHFDGCPRGDQEKLMVCDYFKYPCTCADIEDELDQQHREEAADARRKP